MKYENLFSLTRNESGLVFFEKDNTLIICNWSGYEFDDGGLPVVGPFGTVMPWDYGYGHEVSENGHTDDVLSMFDTDDVSVLYDANGDFGQLLSADLPTPGHWWRIGDCLIIAPDGWN